MTHARMYGPEIRIDADLDHRRRLLVGPGALDGDRVARLERRRTSEDRIRRKDHIDFRVRLNAGGRVVGRAERHPRLRLRAAVRAGHRVPRVAEMQVEPINPAVQNLRAGDLDGDLGGRLLARDLLVLELAGELHLVDIVRSDALAAHERERVPRDGRVLRGVQPHRAVEIVVVLDIERPRHARKVSPRQVLQPEVVSNRTRRTGPGPRSLRRLERCRRWTHPSRSRRGAWSSRRDR